jgi:hypothetical protein
MIASIIAGTVSGLASPFVGAYTQQKNLEAQKQFQKDELKRQEKQGKAQIKLAGSIAIGLALLAIIYMALKD